MLRARKLGVLTPCLLCVEHEASTIYFERVDGMSVKQALSSSALQPAGASALVTSPCAKLCKCLLMSVLCEGHRLLRIVGPLVCIALSEGLPALHGSAARLELLRAIGSAVAALHDGGIVHGDLTTSNLLVRAADNALVRKM